MDLDAVGLADAIRAGQLNAEEAVLAAIERIEAANPAINAVVSTRFEQAMDEVRAGLPDGPLRGVPFLVKEINQDVAGLPTSAGSRLFAGRVAARDSALVSRYRAAGLVILGMTNMPELGKNASTEPVLHGATRNPWNLDRSSGGSSGGSAAAVAAGMVAAAHGNDGGGSIRLPASMCGLFGLKPSRGRVPSDPYLVALSYPLACDHVLTTSVRDSAALLDIEAGPLPGDPYAAPPPERTFVAEARLPAGRLRIGYATTAGTGLTAYGPATRAVETTATLLAELGHEVEPASPDYDAAAAGRAASAVMMANLQATVGRAIDSRGRELDGDDLEPFTHAMLEMGRSVTGREMVESLAAIERTGREVARFFDDYDLFLTPTVGVPTPPLGLLDTTRVEQMMTHAAAFLAFTQLCNVTGQPAMSIPAGLDEGMPVGAHFAARYGDEGTLLRLASQLEQAAPWPRLAPSPLPG